MVCPDDVSSLINGTPHACTPHACTHWSASLPPWHAISYQTPNVARHPPFAPWGRTALPASPPCMHDIPPCMHDIPPGLHGIAPNPTHSRMASSSYPPGLHGIAHQPSHTRRASCSCPPSSLAWCAPPARHARVASPTRMHGIIFLMRKLTWHDPPVPWVACHHLSSP